MKYVSGVYGLNIDNSLNTCGDWHTSSLDWSKVLFLESEEMPWKDWGIEGGKKIPEHEGLFYVADDLRSILDLMYLGRTKYLKGFRDDFLCTDEYNKVFFEKVFMLKNRENWFDIDNLMKKEFMHEWGNFKERVHDE